MPVEESRQMNRALLGAGRPVRYVEIEGMGHGPSSDDEWTKVLAEIDTFLTAHIGQDTAPAPTAKPTR